MAPNQYPAGVRVPERPPRRRARGRVRLRATEAHAELAAERRLDRLRHVRRRVPQRRIQSERRRGRRRDARRGRRAGPAAGRARLVRARKTPRASSSASSRRCSAARCASTPRCSTRRWTTASRSCSSHRSRRRRRATSRRPTSGPRDEPLVARDGASPARRRAWASSTPRSPRAIGSAPAASASSARRCRRIPTRRPTSACYRGQLGGDREWYARVDYRRLGEVFWEPENFVARDPLRSSTFGSESRAIAAGSRRVDRQRHRRGLDLRGIESQRHRLLRQAAAVRRRADLPLLKTLASVERRRR